jgi:hypothetical protein
MATNTLIKLTVQEIEGFEIPQGTSPQNFQIQLFNKARFDQVRELASGTQFLYNQYQSTNKTIKVEVSEDFADVLSALETNSDGNEKFTVTLLEVNGVSLEEDRILNVNKVIKIVKNTVTPTYSDIFYEQNQGQDPQVLTVAEDLDTLLAITADGYYSGGLAVELV